MTQAQETAAVRLETRLLELLQAEWAIATDWTIHCLVQEGILLILIQHPPMAAPTLDPRHLFSVVESALQHHPDLRSTLASWPELYAVRIYVRQQGQAQPYDFYRFPWPHSPHQVGAESLALAGATAPVSPIAASGATVVESTPTTSSPPQAPAPDPPIPLHPTPVATTSPPRQDAPPAVERHADLEVLDAEIASRLRWRWLAPGYGLAAGLAAILLLVGGGSYALSRPCVVGQCEALAIARQIQDTTQRQITPDQSAQTVLDAYDALMEASYLLDRIPSWSSHYTEAQEILTAITEDSNILERVVQAQRLAMDAAVQSQNPPHPLTVWREVQQTWQAAIAQLTQVPDDSPVFPLAQRKLEEYRANLAQIDQRILQEIEAQEWVDLARQTADKATTRQEIVTSVAGLQRVQQNWQSVIHALQRVPSGTMAHAEAQQLLALYRPQLELAEEQLRQERSSVQRYTEARSLAAAAQTAARQENWRQAVGQWEQALAEVQQIPEGSVSFDRAQPLINSYETALHQAQTNLELQAALTALEPICSGAPRRCLLSPQADRIRLSITYGYEQTLAATGDAVVLNQLEPLLEAIAKVGDSTQVPIAVHEADDSLLGIYDPATNRYVSRLN